MREHNKPTQLKNNERKIGAPILTGGVTSVLSALYQQILSDLNINASGISRLMEFHLTNRKNGVPQNLKERASARGNLWKELSKVTMTWKVFCRGLRFLNIPKFHIQITLFHSVGNPTIHSLTVSLDDPSETLFDMPDTTKQTKEENE